MNEVMVIGGVGCYEKDGTAYLNLEAVARGLGFTTTQTVKGTEYTNIRWNRVDEYLKELGFATCGKRPDFIPENIFYRLAMKAKNEAAERFQALVADEIIPSIRKTGGYGITKRASLLTVEDAFRLTELINNTPPEKQPIIRAVFSQAGVHIPEAAGYYHTGRKNSDVDWHIGAFLQEVNPINRPTNDVYQEYVEYCSEHGRTPVSNIIFSKMVSRTLGIKVIDKKVDGKKRRVFVSVMRQKTAKQRRNCYKRLQRRWPGNS